MPFLGVAVIVVLAALALSAFAAWYGAPWAPTPHVAIAEALQVADVGPGDTVVDVGAGDGRVLRAAAARGAAAVGYELAPLVWVIGWLRNGGGRDRVTLRLADGFRADLSAATVIFAFLHPRTVGRLAAALRRQRFTHPVRVVSYAFALPLPVVPTVIRPPGCAPLFLYTMRSPRSALP